MFSFDFLKSKSQVRDIVIIVLAVIIFHWPLFSNGFFQTDDGTLLIIRAGAFLNSFSDLHIPVRIVENLNYGYGYPIFNFFYPGFFYLTEAFHLLGLGLIVSIKASILLLAITGAIGMYLLSQQITNYRLASISAAFFYLFSPYHILDLYKRGSFGELFALAFIPFVTLGIIDYLQKKRKMSLAIAVISTSLVIVGHNTLSIILLPSAYIFGLLFSGFNFANIKKILLVFAFGITVPAFFWVPAIFESIYTVQSKIKIADYTQHFPSLHSFFSDIPFLSPIIRSESNSFPVSIFILLFFVIALWIFFKDHHDKPWRIKILVSLFLITLSVFFMTPLSSMFWKYAALDTFIQFPWRFLSLTTFAGSILIALTLSYFKKPRKIFLMIPLIIFLYYLPQIKVERNFNNDDYYLTNDSTTVNQSELSTVWFDRKINSRPLNLVTADSTFEINNLKQSTKEISFVLNSQKGATVTVNKMYFPHWQLRINGKNHSVEYKSNGLINFSINKGVSTVELHFVDTKLRTLANIITLMSLGSLFILLIKKRL